MTTLYHYCSTTAFLNLVTERALWLSSLSQSNDYMEGKLISQSVARLAKKDQLSFEAIAKLQESLDLMESMFDGLGFCLSEEGDLLSQWRGYAADATGVAVGFDKTYLEWLSKPSRSGEVIGLNLDKVEYDMEAQDLLVTPTYNEMKRLVENGALKRYGGRGLLDSRTNEQIAEDNKAIISANMNLSFAALRLFSHLFLLKSAAFKEEKEWRLVSYLIKRTADTCSYRAANGQIVPYRSYELREMERSPIVNIILGPKHTTPTEVVKNFLAQNGFGEVNVVKSTASYR